jgi:hypothetical protein
MANLPNIFKQIGDTLKVKKPVRTAISPKSGASVNTGTGAGPTAEHLTGTKAKGQPESQSRQLPKPFDFQIYLQATKTAFSKFFKEQIPWFFKNMKPAFKKFPDWWKGLKKDEKVAYGAWAGGHALMIIGILLMILL